jgi:hypothetical protein
MTMDFATHRRFWAAAIPLLVVVSGYFGVPITEDLLVDLGDKAVALLSAGLAAWSLLQPKP